MEHENQRRIELKAFIFITVILFPTLAFAAVGGYGFFVWFLQVVTG
ncbi:periplasmic nitrate reductase system [Photobacterium profundum]|uniref:Periplasmic nitrate reductase system n=1 Tax=Photobacterium profundum 3TCK TaxID=314280 RepID=Q1Z923_9GAMM|nr:periplasmic nitrate reductase, NapE protein [Photobacterium profundum]EAS44935.1 Periplasmic nitrate reductase system [Photobacterium profundum 3TCK]PSV59430.1 periplasmic nitrate reductase system [Photobacterium profundum]